MEYVVVFVMTLAMVSGAALSPADRQQEEALVKQYQEYLAQLQRDRRSSYPGAYYAPAPCGAIAAPAVAPAYLPPLHHAPTFAHALPPPALPHFGYPAIPQYRDADETLGFSDMDQMDAMSQSMFEQVPFDHAPMARYAYGPAPAIAPAYGGASAAAAAAAAAATAALHAAPSPAGPTIGVFPHANTGGCAVPLLLSCSPSISHGQIIKSHASYGGNAYRGVDEPAHETQEDTTHEQLAPAHDTPQSALHQ